MHIAKRMILPAALRYQTEVAGAIANLKATGVTGSQDPDGPLERAGRGDRRAAVGDRPLERQSLDEHPDGDSLAHAKHSRDVMIPAMNAVRAAGDKLELLVADDLWPLPTYQEMLFLK